MRCRKTSLVSRTEKTWPLKGFGVWRVPTLIQVITYRSSDTISRGDICYLHGTDRVNTVSLVAPVMETAAKGKRGQRILNVLVKVQGNQQKQTITVAKIIPSERRRIVLSIVDDSHLLVSSSRLPCFSSRASTQEYSRKKSGGGGQETERHTFIVTL